MTTHDEQPRREGANAERPTVDDPSPGAERRTEARRQVTIEVQVEGSDIDGGSFTERGVTADVSDRGAALILHHPVYVGDRLRLERTDGLAKGKAVVRNVKRQGHEWRVGLEFMTNGSVWALDV